MPLVVGAVSLHFQVVLEQVEDVNVVLKGLDSRLVQSRLQNLTVTERLIGGATPSEQVKEDQTVGLDEARPENSRYLVRKVDPYHLFFRFGLHANQRAAVIRPVRSQPLQERTCLGEWNRQFARPSTTS